MDIREKADELLYKYDLLKLISKYGDAYIVGSYRMGIMTWNDLDFYMDKSGLNAENYYQLASDILKEMLPIHFNGELNIEKGLAFLGFETKISGERWNIDIWWKDTAQINNSIEFAHDIVHLMQERPELKDAVMSIKQELIARRLYGFDKGKKHYHSKEIYDAVFQKGILTTEQFLNHMQTE